MTVDQFINSILSEIVNPFIAILFSLAFLVFMWGLIQFLYQSGSSDKREEGKQHMLWGIIGLFIMLSAYGIVNVVLPIFNIDPLKAPTGPVNDAHSDPCTFFGCDSSTDIPPADTGPVIE
jgi:hypothetical protein